MAIPLVWPLSIYQRENKLSLHIPLGRGAMHIQFGDAGKKKFEPTFIKMQDEYHVIRVQEGDGWIDKDTKVTN